METAEHFSLAQCVASKLMLDLRYYDSGQGQQPVLELIPDLAEELSALRPGGVILFRENLADLEQIQKLTAQIRECLGVNTLIGIDQEGGRVTRLPREACTSFSGNMALAACEEGEALARRQGAAQAAELAALGINVNFVPSLDVNSNGDNPVIGVRSFGDDPQRVATLGAALLEGLQAGGLAGSLKHFPGHGDTHQDSHTDLPQIGRSREQAWQVDLAPFAEVIQRANPAMVMTAHIQYPSLDSSTIKGTDTLVPATLSRKMMTDLLRGEMGFKGLIITDALDMRAISDMLSPTEAVKACFQAGVDIALMPLLVRSGESFRQLGEMVEAVVQAVDSGQLDEQEVRTSAARVRALQSRLATAVAVQGDIALTEHLKLEQSIAESSLTLLSGQLSPLTEGARVHVLMPGEETASAMREALMLQGLSLEVSHQSLEAFDAGLERDLVGRADFYLMGVSEPATSAVVVGGAEDLPGLAGEQSPAELQQALLQLAKGRPRAVLMLNSPYRASEFQSLAELVLASYDGAPQGFGGSPGPAFKAVARALCGRIALRGSLPVRPGL